MKVQVFIIQGLRAVQIQTDLHNNKKALNGMKDSRYIHKCSTYLLKSTFFHYGKLFKDAT